LGGPREIQGREKEGLVRYNAIMRYVSGALYAGSPLASSNIQLKCQMEHNVCTPLAKLKWKIFIWLRFMVS